MVSRTQRLIFLGIAVVVVIVAIVVLTSGGGSSDEGFTSGVLTLSPAKPQQIKVHQGDRVTFKVTSPTADEVHLHGYDIHKDVPAGGTITMTVQATSEGLFDIELEDANKPLGQLAVEPR